MTTLTWDRVFEKYLVLAATKNGDRREVPLSGRAREILKTREGIDDKQVFPVDSQLATMRFSTAKNRTPFKDVRFHDARSEAVTRLSRKLDVMQLAKMIGHRDLKSLMFYYAESSDSLADRL
jgi:integrase